MDSIESPMLVQLFNLFRFLSFPIHPDPHLLEEILTDLRSNGVAGLRSVAVLAVLGEEHQGLMPTSSKSH